MLICMRTTLNIDDSLMKKVRKLAAERGQTLTELIEGALWKAVQAPSEPGEYKLEWVTVKGKTLPGVDLTDRDLLYERMEERH